MGAVVGAVVSSVVGGGVVGAAAGALAAGVTNNLIGGGSSSGGGGGGGGGSSNTASNTGATGSSTPANLTAEFTPGAAAPVSLGPSFASPQLYNSDIMHAAKGGPIDTPDPFYWESMPHHMTEGSSISSMHGTHPHFAGFEEMYPHFAEGGEAEHIPEFYSEGGLQHTFVRGGGTGTSDSVPAMLATGEFVIPADVVSSLGNGDSNAGSHALDGLLKNVRKHRQSNSPNELPPDSKNPLDYLKGSA